MTRRKPRVSPKVVDVTEWVREAAGDLCKPPPLELCAAETPAGECVRAPHDAKLWHIASDAS
jgi:hypothetical protein